MGFDKDMTIGDFLDMQHQLQIGMGEANPDCNMGDPANPYEMSPVQLARFITWNHTALTVELGEMMAEVGWKPWASDRSINAASALKEMVDVWHFFLNILLAIDAWYGRQGPEFMGPEFERRYVEKNAKNLQRQVDGYDGITGKCTVCKREIADIPNDGGQNVEVRDGLNKVIAKFCSWPCHDVYKETKGIA
jgi:hypothetical protein